MSSWTAAYHRMEAAQRRDERAAQRRRRELERQFRESAKLSALEQARLEVDAYENGIDLLLSVHKEQSRPIDWTSLVAALPPYPPPRMERHEMAARFEQLTNSIALAAKNVNASERSELLNHPVDEAKALDEKEHGAARALFAGEVEECEKLRSLARRVLAGESRAYTEALSALSPFEGVESLGSSIHMTVHSSKAISCELKVNGRDIVPAEAKSLTASGKLSVKPMPKTRAYEIYQDHVCACTLRLAREMFALLPLETVVVTALIDSVDSRTGNAAEVPILSVQITRSELRQLEFERLDPSDAIEAFIHHGDVKVSRKTGQFVPVEPLTPDMSVSHSPEKMAFRELLKRIQELRRELHSLLKPAEGVMVPTNSNVQVE